MRYDPKKIEQKWQRKWLAAETYEPDFKRVKKPFYNLMMFPYPSAEGLHIGAMRTFTGIDMYGRFKRMQGYDVFEPIGLDAFGIHSENYALKTGRHPTNQARILEKNFYRQLAMMGNGFSWNEHLETNDVEYYRWTQWIFVVMFKRGLAYRKKQEVNWCPSCKTVLADEQVIGGECERCGTIVTKKELEQWFFKITDYADRLLKHLEKLDWSERVKIAQRNWIGKSEGAMIKFQIRNSKDRMEVFTTRPDTLFGATYLVVAPEHEFIESHRSQIANYREVAAYTKKARAKAEAERIADEKEKTGVEVKGVKAINPANNEEIPIFVADYVLGGYGTGAIMAVPSHDKRDFEFAKKYELPIRRVVEPPAAARSVYPRNAVDLAMGAKAELHIVADCWIGEGVMINSGKFTGMGSEKAKWKITEFVGGRRVAQYHLRDWLLSRQRYWGPPIPMIFCDACAAKRKGERPEMPGWYAVPKKDLPVKLPFVKNFRPTGTDQSPLAAIKYFVKVRCPGCRSWARRETDVSDTFLDSAWYFLRYPSVRNRKVPWDPAITKKWLPVNVYIGGAEHSVLHLMYSRFLTMAFHDAKLLSFEEPFPKFRAHGLITKDGAKMSKSKGNVVNPDEYIHAYGADAVRMYLAFMAPFEQGGDFRDNGIRGMTRFLERVWKFFEKESDEDGSDPELQRHLHKTIRKVTEDIKDLQYNTAIAALMVLLNQVEHRSSPDATSICRNDKKIFLKLLAPFAPHIAEELWQELAKNEKRKTKKGFKSIHREAWPQYDPGLIKEEIFDLVVQINGKTRATVSLDRGVSEQEATRLVRNLDAVKRHLSGEAQRIIFVPDKLINFVV